MTLEQFTAFVKQFKNSTMYHNMANTVENSPYHRESNVGVHTDAVVAEYIKSVSDKWDTGKYYLGALACLFHDVGKPKSEEVKHSESRGEYRSYKGHELVSTRLFEQYALEHKDTMCLSALDVFLVGWMIQNHLPYAVKKPIKLQALYDTTYQYNVIEPFVELLLADQNGRVSDNKIDNLAKVQEWVNEFRLMTPSNNEFDENAPTMYMLIGPSGAGKSTFAANIQSFDAAVNMFSWDTLRQEWYDVDESIVDPGERYAKAFEQSIKDSEFSSKANKTFIDLVRTGEHIVVDNTNLSPKRRRFFSTEAMKRGYKIVACVCMVERNELIRRTETRGNRNIPTDVVINMHENMTYPSITTECHSIWALFT